MAARGARRRRKEAVANGIEGAALAAGRGFLIALVLTAGGRAAGSDASAGGLAGARGDEARRGGIAARPDGSSAAAPSPDSTGALDASGGATDSTGGAPGAGGAPAIESVSPVRPERVDGNTAVGPVSGAGGSGGARSRGSSVVVSAPAARAAPAHVAARSPPPRVALAPRGPAASGGAASDEVLVQLLVAPPGVSHVYWGVKDLGVAPLDIVRPRGSGPLDLILRAPGYLTFHTRAFTDHDDKIAIHMVPSSEAPRVLGYRPTDPTAAEGPARTGAPPARDGHDPRVDGAARGAPGPVSPRRPGR
jgi:hypothetical protein